METAPSSSSEEDEVEDEDALSSDDEDEEGIEGEGEDEDGFCLFLWRKSDSWRRIRASSMSDLLRVLGLGRLGSSSSSSRLVLKWEFRV